MREALRARILALIARLSDGSRDDLERDALLADLAAYQREHVEPYARLMARRPKAALPADVFRYARVASFDPQLDVRVFRTSGTTSGARGEHAFRDLSIYDAAALAAARHALFPDAPQMRLVMLAPHPDEVPDSSLSYMLGRFESWFASRCDWVWRGGALDAGRLAIVLAESQSSGEPVALLGTSFALVHAEERLQETFRLPIGSRIMQTGGFKGRSRELEPEALRAALGARYGVPGERIVAEYGMTELSSQMYETLDASSRRLYWVPGWVRARAVDPETLEPRPDGELGVLRIDDAANLDSVSAIQTSDLARIHGGRIELVGRAPGAQLRGCSLAVEEALDGR
ncbi:MAG: acyl-protein synthetase [Sandaracinaceae bacterium]|nr:acyl-protein synthetase [Sandaracinaceae bacterium]